MDLATVKTSAFETLEDALAVIERLMVEVRKLEEETAELRRENGELKVKVAELAKDSSTSSKPPSSDIVKPPRERRQPGKRKRGGQRGHSGVTRTMLPPEEVDHREDLPAEQCPACGLQLEAAADIEPQIQQVIELPEKPWAVTEYRRGAGRCPGCGELHYAPLPAGVIEGQLFGPRLQALMGYMKGNLGASYTELSQFCADVLGVPVSTGHLANVVQRVSAALQAPYEELEQALPAQESLNVDETGWRERGNKLWVWLFCNPRLAYFTIQASRGSAVLRRVLGDTFEGALISDFYSAYVCYANARQQFCLAHLIRDIKFLTTLPDEATQAFGQAVLTHFKLLFDLWHDRDRSPPEQFQHRAARLKAKLYVYLCEIEVPPGKATTLHKRLVKHWEALFRFVEDPGIYEPTNNLAEQTLRPLIRIRRQTQGSRSAWGRLWTARIMTTLETCRKQNRNAWAFLQQAVNAHYFNSPPPSLLPTT